MTNSEGKQNVSSYYGVRAPAGLTALKQVFQIFCQTQAAIRRSFFPPLGSSGTSGIWCALKARNGGRFVDLDQRPLHGGEEEVEMF